MLMKFFNIKGFSFGLSSSVITTLGLMIGLNSSTGSRLAVIGGILTIAVADAMSDALAVHISEEAENNHSIKEVWTSTISTIISKFFWAISFIVPVLFFELDFAIIISIIWGLLLMTILSYFMAKNENKKAYRVIGEHVLIAISVIIISNYVGLAIAHFFG